MPPRDSTSDQPSLQANRLDHGVAIGRAVAGAVPWFGASLQELITATIPNQRLDRVVDCLQRFEAKLSDLEEELVQRRLRDDEEAIDLFEEGMVQGTRALSEDRREYIASLLKSSLTSDELEHVEKSKLWSLLDALNDVELLILQLHGVRHSPTEQEFRELHADALDQPRVHLGSSQEEMDHAAVYKSYQQHLVNLGLLRPRFARPRRGELPEFDGKTGMIKATGHELTNLGSLLLRELDLPTRS